MPDAGQNKGTNDTGPSVNAEGLVVCTFPFVLRAASGNVGAGEDVIARCLAKKNDWPGRALGWRGFSVLPVELRDFRQRTPANGRPARDQVTRSPHPALVVRSRGIGVRVALHG